MKMAKMTDAGEIQELSPTVVLEASSPLIALDPDVVSCVPPTM